MKYFQIDLSLLIMFIFAGLFSSAQVPLNWYLDEINPGEDVILIPDETEFTEGYKSVHMRLNSGAVPYLYSDVFYVAPGADFAFSMDVFDNDTSGQVKIYADFYDTFGFNIYGPPPAFSADSAQWQAISLQGTVPAQAVVGYILVKFYCQPDLYHFTKPADGWIDNAQFRQSEGINLVINGGFENWDSGNHDNEIEKEALKVFPNPASDFIQVELPANASAIFISDMTGREILNVNIEGKKQIRFDIVNWNKGFYIIHAVLDQNMILTKKLIVL